MLSEKFFNDLRSGMRIFFWSAVVTALVIGAVLGAVVVKLAS